MSETIEWTRSQKGFGTLAAQDEGYHGRAQPEKHHEMTETWYWGFYEPESQLHGFIHIWTHPNLNLCTGGLFAHFGHKREHLAAELFDFRNFTPDTIIDDAGNIKLANGLTVTFEEPMQRMRIAYENAARGFRLDMLQSAVQPPIVRANNRHFEQTMRATGSVVFQGREYRFDNLSIRDRSWGERRPEDGHLLPPYTWMNGAFSEDFAFCISGHDDPARAPDWSGLYQLAPERLMSDAWIYDHGRMLRLTRMSKLTERAWDGLRPLRSTIDCVAEDGRSFRFVGEIIASNPWHCWQNALCHCGLTRWTSPQFPRVIAWGETQEVQWNDYVARRCRPVQELGSE
jgi:hypothetical protein